MKKITEKPRQKERLDSARLSNLFKYYALMLKFKKENSAHQNK